MKHTLLSVFIMFFIFRGVAQPGCPNVNAGNDVTLPCSTQCTNLTATAFQTGATTSYSVASIPYTPFSYTAGTSILVNTDDIWSDVIPLPFTFCFFGQAYNNVVVGANGLISFDQSVALQGCAWNITSAGPLPTTNVYGNTIMGPYHDIDPSLGGTIKYQIIGSAPCRIFVISYNQVPMYESDNFLSDCSGLDATHQIAIYETTNAIEIYIKHKDSCPGGFFTSGWNDGLAIEGIQNAAQNQAFVVPGRNNSVWNADNDAWRFTPNGPSIVSIAWYQGSTLIGNGSTVQVCPSSTTTYTAEATYLPCAGGTPVVVTDDVTISLAGLQVDATGQNIACFGATNGQATATLTNGTNPINYGWSNGSNALSINGLAAGTYVFTATDAANCTRRDTVIITQPLQLTANVPDVTQTNCSGLGTGTLVATSAGGTGPYSFNWNSSPVQNDSILNGVAPGNYTVTVTDANGCTAGDNGTLTIQVGGNNVTLNVTNFTNVNCNGDGSGSVTVAATGGSGVYTYTWSNSAPSNPAITGLSGGTYSVTVDDGGGCTASATQTITEPTALVINNAAVQNIGCGATAAGAINVNTTGGTGAYTYNWVQAGNSQTYSGNPLVVNQPDTYNVTVTDANGCTDTANYQVTQVPALTFTQASTNLTCNASNDGTATINVTSGTPPYNYNWNGNGNTASNTLQGLAAGITNVTITDVYCTATATFNLTEPPAIVVNQTSATNVSCFGGNNGSITVDASGGSGSGYAYTWSNAQTGATATGLSANVNYVVTAVDGNNCSVSASYTLTEPAQLTTSPLETPASCAGAANGSIDINPAGGTPPYIFLWSNNQTTQVATNLTAGNYICQVTDNNGCTTTNTAAVTEPAPLVTTYTAEPVKCVGDKNGFIAIGNTAGGTPPFIYTATIDNVNFYNPVNDTIINLGAGDYTLSVTDANGCSASYTVTVPNATFDNYVPTADSTSCYGPDYNDGRAHIEVLPPAPNGPYQFSIDGGALQYSGDFFGLSAGQHIITAVNANNCATQWPVVVLQPLPIVVDINPDTVYLELGESAPVVATYINAPGTATYLWTGAVGLSCTDCANPVVGPYESTDYLLTVSAQNGTSTCYGSATLHAEVAPQKPVFIPNAFSPNGDGNNDVFMIYGQDIRTIDLTIFNRWGELVFKSNNAFEGWDGTFKSQLQLPGVYTYNAAITFLNGKTTREKGTVTILR